MNNRLAISGCSGFVGKNLTLYLKNNDIQVISRVDLYHDNFNRFTDTYAFIHLAGKAHDLNKTSVPEDYYEANFEVTKRLYDAFLKSDAKKFVFVSSVKASADTIIGVLTEETEVNPQTHYGKSKRLAEEYIQRQLLPEGKSYYILRPCMIHGPGNKGNLNLLYKFVSNGIPYPLAAFKNERSFLSIENLCFVIKEILQNPIPSGIYNVADDETLSTTEVVAILANSLNRLPIFWKIPSKFLMLLAKIGDIIKLPINTERLKKLTESYVVSNEKIKKAVGVPFPIGAKEGLLKTANSFKQETGLK
ncbi:NAD-dependent epimerase/dehydratase family protein [Pedobacter jeongneungensis]|uniref:NAD-dependent epimerase/dehydratase family protein n=1 Tax=Pedobacter jeongneungensis TaxID=947309 RepID=UPI00046AF8FC|nr:NAD-dependent epimerase/dehydratase family protein [Pedobacter jeongneungensis]